MLIAMMLVTLIASVAFAEPPSKSEKTASSEVDRLEGEAFPQPWKLVVRRKGIQVHEYRVAADESIFHMVFDQADAQDGIAMMMMIAAVSKDRPFEFVATNRKLSIGAEARAKLLEQLPETPDSAAYDVATNVKFFKDKPSEDIRAISIAGFRHLWNRQDQPLIVAE